jgi:HlyD family secretion protein
MTMKAANLVFRKAALDRLASPEQLDELIPVVDARGWVAALGISVLTAAVIAWGFLGSIPTEVLARGILVTQGGRVVSALSPSSGVVASLTVKPGDVVQRGQAVATIHQPQAELHLANARQVEAEQAVAVETRGASLQREAQALEANATQRKRAQDQVIEQASQRIGRLRRQLEIREQMHPRNLELEERVEQVQADLARAQQDVSDAQARMVEIDTVLLHSRLEGERELAGLRAGLADAKRATAQASAALDAARDVLAPATGKVTELAVSEGQMVTANGPVLNVETEGRRLQALVYVPTEHGKQIYPGMTARVALSTVNKREWGALNGRVASISDFPATPQGMAAVLGNPQLVQNFGGGSAPYNARIDLQQADTPSGYAWSSGTGPTLDLSSGTTLSANIEVREEQPVNLILPSLRRATGVTR